MTSPISAAPIQSIEDTKPNGIVDGEDMVTVDTGTTLEEKDGKQVIVNHFVKMDAETFLRSKEYAGDLDPKQKLDTLCKKMKKDGAKETPKASSDLIKLCEKLMAEKKAEEKKKVAVK